MTLCAAAEIVKTFPNAHFVFAGEGERIGELENLAEKLQIKANTHFIGRCRIVPELLSISEICLLTSTAEGFSNSILEYMSAAKPVIATDVGGAKEAIIEGETGFLVESNDDRMLAEKLLLLLKDSKKAEIFGKKGKQIVEEKFSTEKQKQTLLSIYKTELER